jgi:hypothetical protein
VKPLLTLRRGGWQAALLLGAAACTTVKDCTTIGCADGVVISAPSGVVELSTGTLTVCVEDDCQETRFDPGPGIDVTDVQFPDMGEGDHVTAVLVMPDGSRYEDEVEASSNRPNGPGCSPVCIDAELALA